MLEKFPKKICREDWEKHACSASKTIIVAVFFGCTVKMTSKTKKGMFGVWLDLIAQRVLVDLFVKGQESRPLVDPFEDETCCFLLLFGL